MPGSSGKGPSQWYARAREYRALADALPKPERVREAGVREDDLDFEERQKVFEQVHRQLLKESEKCWAAGGRREMERTRR